MDKLSCCQGFLCGNILRDVDMFSDLVFNFYLFCAFWKPDIIKITRDRITSALFMNTCIFSAPLWCAVHLLLNIVLNIDWRHFRGYCDRYK